MVFRKKAVLVVVALFLALAIGGSALAFAAGTHMAQPAVAAQTTTTIYECLTGTNIDTSVTPSSVLFTCPAGDTSIAVGGMSGFVIVYSKYYTVSPGVIESVACPAGDVPLGGGVELGNLNIASKVFTVAHDSYVTLSRPNASSNGWWGAYGGNTTTIRIWAECALVA